MKLIRIILLGLVSLITLTFLGVAVWYKTLENRERAEFWFSFRNAHPQGSFKRQWLIDQAIKADSSFAEAYMQKSISYNKRGDFSNGMRILENAVNLDPASHLGYRGFLKLYMLHDYEGALADYYKLDSLTPDFRDAPWGEDIYQVIGLCYQGMSNYSLAMNYYDTVLQENSDWIDNQVYLYRGMVEIKTGQFDQAIDDLTKGVMENPMSEYYYYLALAHFQIDSLQKGCDYLLMGIDRFNAGYFRSNPYYELPGQVYLSDFKELAEIYCEN